MAVVRSASFIFIGTGIFSVRSAINEPFANPHAVKYLKAMREKAPNELISFVTNGSYFTPAVVDELAELAPLFFNLSLYSTDPNIRHQVLRDRKRETAVRACELLAAAKVPYMTNLVMWPTIPLSDMTKTIAHAERCRAAVVRVCLGGYSRYLPGDFERFDVDEYWPTVVKEVERIRGDFTIPVLIEPSSYVQQSTDAVVDGVIVDSPAALAGIRRGDVIDAVGNTRVLTRTQLLSALRRGAQSRFRPPGVAGMLTSPRDANPEHVVLDVRRGDKAFQVTLSRYDARSMDTYPYSKIATFEDFIYGLVITDSLRYSSLKAVRQAIDRRGAKKTLLLTSQMIKPILEHMMARSNVFDGIDVDLRVPSNEYFGGSINIGDLLTVGDFAIAIEKYCAENGAPDLVLIPGSPFATSPWGRDLTGTPWTEISRRTGLTVERADCSPLVF